MTVASSSILDFCIWFCFVTSFQLGKHMNELSTVSNDNEMMLMEQTAKRLNLSNELSKAMCRSTLLPQHLRAKKVDGVWKMLDPEETQANCILIVNQALRWGVDPFAILPSTFVVGGNLGFDGKLIAAIVNKLGNLAEKLTYTFAGVGDDLTVTVSGRIEGESEPRTVTVSVGQAKTDNDIWKKDPEQKLCYTGATRWARRHCPQVILGIVSDDEPPTSSSSTVEAVSVRRMPEPKRDMAKFLAYQKQIDETTDPSLIQAIANNIQSEPLEVLNEDEQEELVQRARRQWRHLSSQETQVEPQVDTEADDGLTPGFRYYSEKIRSEERVGILSSMRSTIENDDELSDEDRNDVLELLKERLAIMQPGVKG